MGRILQTLFVSACLVLFVQPAYSASTEDYIKAADIMMKRGFSPVQVYFIAANAHGPCDPNQGCGYTSDPWTADTWTNDKAFVRYLERKAGLPNGGMPESHEDTNGEVRGWTGHLYFDVETGLPLPSKYPVKFAKQISTCYKRGQPWKDCKLRYNQLDGCYMNKRQRDLCSRSFPGHQIKAKHKGGWDWDTAEACWRPPAGDAIVFPAKVTKSRLVLKTAKRLSSSKSRQLPKGNYLQRRNCPAWGVFQTRERKYHGPVRVPSWVSSRNKNHRFVPYCVPAKAYYDAINETGPKSGTICGERIARWFCSREGYGGVASFKKANQLGATEFGRDVVCNSNCTGFAEIVCNKPQWIIVGEFSEEGRPAKTRQLKQLASLGDLPDFQVRDSFDLIGSDLSNAKGVKSAKACAQRCSKASGCAGFTYDKWNKWCFLKTSAAELRLEPKTVSGIRTSLSLPSRSAARTIVKHYRGKTFPYKGFKTAKRKSFDSCKSWCLEEEKCVAYSFEKSSRSCRLLDSAGEYFSDAGVDSGVKRQALN